MNNYLHLSTRAKLLKAVEEELLARYETQLLEKEHSGCAALLNDDKKADLSRMYRLFQRVPKVSGSGGLEIAASGLLLFACCTSSFPSKTDFLGFVRRVWTRLRTFSGRTLRGRA